MTALIGDVDNMEQPFLFTMHDVTKDDCRAIIDLGQIVSEQCIIPTLSEQGKKTVRESRYAVMREVADPRINKAIKVIYKQKLIGFVAWRFQNNVVRIPQFYIDPNFQRRGIGRALFEKVLAESCAKTIELNASVCALGFYKKLGFIPMVKQNNRGVTYYPMRYVA